MTTIYALRDPRTGEIRYVGRTRNGTGTRLWTHVSRSVLFDDTPKARWIKELFELDLVPELIELERVHERDEVAAEAHWIEVIGRRHQLTNLSRVVAR